MSSSLDEIEAAADAAADDERTIARRARAMQLQRDRGWSWRRILDQEETPPLLHLLRRSALRLRRATGQFAQTLADGLSADGQSQRQIARRLGLSHQRVSRILSGDNRARGHRPARPDH